MEKITRALNDYFFGKGIMYGQTVQIVDTMER
jgi:hypothetical protein